MRDTLGDGYVDALRSAYADVPESVDFVLYWWNKAAHLVRATARQQAGLITTNFPSADFFSSRRYITSARRNIFFLNSQLRRILMGYDSADGAAVRIAMTVGRHGKRTRKACRSYVRTKKCPDGTRDVTFQIQIGSILSNLSIGAADTSSAATLAANMG